MAISCSATHADTPAQQADPRGRFSMDAVASERIRLIEDLRNDGRERVTTKVRSTATGAVTA